MDYSMYLIQEEVIIRSNLFETCLRPGSI